MTANSNVSVQRRAPQRGVTLLENMVALLVISVGLLGFAGMQAFTLRGSASSTHRQLAMQLAQDMADRIRANPGAYFDAADTTNRYHGITPDPAPSSTIDCRTVRCDAVALAAYDIAEWQLANHALPGADDVAGGYVVSEDLFDTVDKTPLRINADPMMPVRKRFTIAIRWDGDGSGSTKVGTTPTDCSETVADPTALKCYALVIDR